MNCFFFFFSTSKCSNHTEKRRLGKSLIVSTGNKIRVDTIFRKIKVPLEKIYVYRKMYEKDIVMKEITMKVKMKAVNKMQFP